MTAEAHSNDETPQQQAWYRLLRNQSFDGVFRWILLAALICFGAVILWDYGFLGYLFSNDTSGISSLIIAVFTGFSLYCIYAIVDASRDLRTLETISAKLETGDKLTHAPEEVRIGNRTISAARPLGGFLHDASIKLETDPEGGLETLMQVFSAQMRRGGRLGIFVADVLYKMGMLGTVIGFIAMLVSMRDLGEFDVETMRMALQQMTGGMAIALLTTITGLVCGVLLRLEFNILDNVSTRIVMRTVRLSELFLAPKIHNAGK